MALVLLLGFIAISTHNRVNGPLQPALKLSSQIKGSCEVFQNNILHFEGNMLDNQITHVPMALPSKDAGYATTENLRLTALLSAF
jgi:hypothetical protein